MKKATRIDENLGLVGLVFGLIRPGKHQQRALATVNLTNLSEWEVDQSSLDRNTR